MILLITAVLLSFWMDGEGNPSEVDTTSEDDIALDELAKTISLLEVVTDTALLYKQLKQQRNTLNGILVKLRHDDFNDDD